MKRLYFFILLFCIAFKLTAIPLRSSLVLHYLLLKNKVPIFLQEGICAGVQIKTPTGYKLIEHLKQGDIIVGLDQFGQMEEKPIVAILKGRVNNYIRIKVDNEIINIGRDQKLYLSFANEWRSAHEIINLNQLGDHSCVAQCIYQEREVFYISVKRHNFCITQKDICVHNADFLVIDATTIMIGCIKAVNPVLKMLGVMTLSAPVDLDNKELVQYVLYDAINSERVDSKILLHERMYYEQRKKDLLNLRQQLVNVAQGLKNIKELCNAQTFNFTYQLLQGIQTSVPKVNFQLSVADELKLSTSQKIELYQMRKKELLQLEQEILDFQITAVFHLSELINRKEQAFASLNAELPNINKKIAVWNQCVESMTYEVAIEAYENEFYYESLIEDIRRANYELKLAITYYKKSCNATVIKSSTTIMEVLFDQEKEIIKNEKYINETQRYTVRAKKVCEQYFLADSRINISHVRRKVKERVKNRKKKSQAKELVQVKQKRSSIKYPKGPDDEENKKKHPHDKYQDAPYHHKNSSGLKSKAPKNGQAALDNSVPLDKSNPKRRVGTSEDEIVILDKTLEGLFHGHVRTWAEIIKDPGARLIKRALEDSGLVNKMGKILL